MNLHTVTIRKFLYATALAGVVLAMPATHAQERAAVAKNTADNTVVGYTVTTNLKDEKARAAELVNTINQLQTRIRQVKDDIAACENTGGTVTRSPDTVTVINLPTTPAPSNAAPSSCIFGDVLCTFYKDVTGGLPDGTGVAFWQGEIDRIQQANPSATNAEIIAALKVKAALTPEAIAHAGTGAVNDGRSNVDTFGNANGTTPVAASTQTDANQLESLYHNIMGRGSDAVGKAWYEEQLSTGKMTINDIANHMAACKANNTCQ